MLHLYSSNKPQPLAAALAAVLQSDPQPLLTAETVLVPASGVGRWLGFYLAEKLGIAARIQFPFPAAYVWTLFGKVLPEVPDTSPFKREALTWRLLRLIGEVDKDTPIARYLADGDGIKRFELAERLAETYERYLIYRPQWIGAWTVGKRIGLGQDTGDSAEIWQAQLWRDLLATLPHAPQDAEAHPKDRFFAALRADPAARARLPRRLCLFGVQAMPPQYFDIFLKLAEFDCIDLHLFLLNPSRQYWGDIVRNRERLGAMLEQAQAVESLDPGHPLLASLGKASRYFFSTLAAVSPTTEHEFYVEPEVHDDIATNKNQRHACSPHPQPLSFARPVLASLARQEQGQSPEGRGELSGSLLATLQADILDLRPPSLLRRRLAPVERSLQIHACHGPLREAEVLHDRLLDLFEADPTLRPSDVLVLTPDIDAYAPAIEAVFSAAEPALRIPFTVADREVGNASLWRAIERLCQAAAGELDAESVLATLEEPALRRAWDIEEGELPLLRDWVRLAAIRWGKDAAALVQRGLPPEAGHTWRAGLQRLLLGIAMRGEPPCIYVDGESDILPLDAAEGSKTALLGRFVGFVEALFDLADDLAREQPAEKWAALLERLLAQFLAPDETEENEAQRIRVALTHLAEVSATNAAADPVLLPFVVIQRYIARQLAETAPPHAFLGGGLTLAALLPQRAVPARVICLVGMNDGSFPRQRQPLSFDLCEQHPQPGDRDHRAEERYALLEALLCADDALIVTYTGRDARSNIALPPAAPLAELLDTLRAGWESAAGEDALSQLLIEHPLQPFSARYFQPGPLFTYTANHVATVPSNAPQPFLDGSITADACASQEIELDQLARFFDNPAKALLRDRLGIHLEQAEEVLETSEPFKLDNLERYQVNRAILESLTANDATPQDIKRLIAARGLLPHGVAGDIAFDGCWREIQPLWQAARPWLEQALLEPCTLVFDDGEIQLVGQFNHLAAYGHGIQPSPIMNVTAMPVSPLPQPLSFARPVLASLARQEQGQSPGGRGELRESLRDFYGIGQFLLHPGKARPKDRLRLWLSHLLLNTAQQQSVSLRSFLLTLDGVESFAPLPADVAASHLRELLALYRRGQNELLPFYPKTAWAYAEAVAKENPDGKWEAVWHGQPNLRPPRKGEQEDPYMALATRGVSGPLGESFRAIALTVFVPLGKSLERSDS